MAPRRLFFNKWHSRVVLVADAGDVDGVMRERFWLLRVERIMFCRASSSRDLNEIVV